MTERQFASRSGAASGPWIAMFTLAVTVALIGIQWLSEMPPAVRDTSSGFSGSDAMKDLSYILRDGEPHPTGTPRNAAVKTRIETLLRGLGYQPEEQNEYTCDQTGICAGIENVVVRIPGIQPEDGVLLDAHYDSVAAAPGAADNGSGVAIATEIGRLLKTGGRLNHPVILLFDDGEEQQLLGAQAFVQRNPAAQIVKWVVNMDARGVTGPSMMFETSQGNAAILPLYAHNTQRPVANSLMFDLYRQLPSDTNFTVFRKRGWKGFNLAFLGKTQFYHRTADAVRNTDPRSVQHQGEEALSLVRALADSPPKSSSRNNAVFFDLFSRVFWWSNQWSGYATAVAAILLVCGCVLRRNLLSPAGVALSTLVAPLTLALAGLAAFLTLRVVLPGNLVPMLFVPHPGPFSVAFFTLGIAVAMALYRMAQIKTSVPDSFAGLCIFWTVCAAAISLLLVGGSYLFVLPALAMTALFLWVDAKSSILSNSVLFPATVLTGVLWIPLLRLLYNAGGIITFPLMTVFAANLLLLFLPLLQGVRRWLYPGALASLLVAAISAAAGMHLPRYTRDSPLPLNLSYVQTASGESYWVTACAPRNLWRIRSLVDAVGFRAVGQPDTLLPWTEKQIPLLSASAPHLDLGKSELQVVSDSINQGEVTVVARMQAAPGMDRSVLYIAPTVKLQSMAIGGKPIPVEPGSQGRWRAYETTVGTNEAGVGVTFTFANGGSHEMYLETLRNTLPPEAAPLLKARPPEAMASQDGNRTIVVRRVNL